MNTLKRTNDPFYVNGSQFNQKIKSKRLYKKLSQNTGDLIATLSYITYDELLNYLDDDAIKLQSELEKFRRKLK